MCGGFKHASSAAGDARLMMRHRLENACFDGNRMLSMDMVEKHNAKLMSPAIANQITRESITEPPAPLLLNHPVAAPYQVKYEVKETKHIDLNVECEKLSKQKKEGISIRRSSTPFTSEIKLSCGSNPSLSFPPGNVKYPTPPPSNKTQLLNRDKISNMNFDLQEDCGNNPVLYRKFGRKITASKNLNSAANTPVHEDLFILNGFKPNKPMIGATHLNASERKARPETSVQLPQIKENLSLQPPIQPLPSLFARWNSMDPFEYVIKENTTRVYDEAHSDESHSDEDTTSSSDHNSEDDEDSYGNEYGVLFEKSIGMYPRKIPMKEKVNSYLNSIREN